MKITIVLLSLSLLLTGCLNNSLEQTKNTTSEQVSIVPKEVMVVETQELPPTEEAQNIEGDLYYIKTISDKDNKTFIEIDKIEWLSFIDNTCSTPPEVKAGMPQCNSNGFLIQNSSPDLKTYEVLPQASIQTTEFGANPSANTKMNLQKFNESFASQKEYFESTPFIIQIENGKITAIQQKYVP